MSGRQNTGSIRPGDGIGRHTGLKIRSRKAYGFDPRPGHHLILVQNYLGQHMIIFDLSCNNNHQFEGWFGSAEDFERQIESRLVICPQCDSHSVRRIPSAVAIAKNAKEGSVPSANVDSTVLMPVGAQAMALYRQLVQTIMANSEDVGQSFAEEARKIHYNESPERAIRGHATVDECDELRDEGIAILSLPGMDEGELN